jgi:NADH-quinone oxidoreductase subunit K
MSMELLFLSTNIINLFSSFILDDSLGLLFLLIILTIAASESSVGLAILVIYYKLRGIIKIESLNVLKG